MVSRPFSMPQLSLSTLATGARPLVVQEALEMMWCLAGSYFSSFTPSTMVMSSFLAGAEMITFFAAGVDVRLGLGGVGEEAGGLDDDLRADLAPGDLGRGRARRRPESACRRSTKSSSSTTSTVPRSGRSCCRSLNRWALVAVSMRSLMATTSMSSGCRSRIAFRPWRPIRPKPLMPTRVAIGYAPSSVIISVTLRDPIVARTADRGQRVSPAGLRSTGDCITRPA